MTAPLPADHDLVALDPRARRAWPWLPGLSRAGRIHVGPLGELLVITDTGGADVIVTASRPWDRSIASDPAATRGTPR